MSSSRPRAEKLLPYESGSDAMLGFGQSNVRYYIYALLFVMFDVEAVFIFPWAIRLEALGVFGLVEMIVFIVILAGPLVGLALTWPAKRLGHWVVAFTMAGSLVFGLVNHFVYDSPDHVAHVAVPWRPLFATTAILLVLTESLGCILAIRRARERKSVS